MFQDSLFSYWYILLVIVKILWLIGYQIYYLDTGTYYLVFSRSCGWVVPIYITYLLVHPLWGRQNPVVERFPDSSFRYWYILSCVGNIPLVAYLATWYSNLLPEKLLLFFRCFRLQMQYWRYKTPEHTSLSLVWVSTHGNGSESYID